MHVKIAPLRPHIQKIIILFNIPTIDQVLVFAFICKDSGHPWLTENFQSNILNYWH